MTADTRVLDPRRSPSRDQVVERIVLPAALLAFAGLGWWWSGRMSTMNESETLSLAGFVLAWLAMMTAMMFPTIVPVVRLYSRAAARGAVAPLPFFVAGYIIVWTAVGLPAYAAWRWLMMPLSDARPWAGRVAGTALLLSAPSRWVSRMGPSVSVAVGR